MKRSIWLAAVLSFGPCTMSLAQIGGTITLQGTPPEMKEIKAIATIPDCAKLHKDPEYEDTVIAGDKGELANVIVFIKENKPGELKEPPTGKPATLDQKGCRYRPHVLAVQVGQPVVVINSDPFLHNVHCLAAANKPFNVVQLNVGEMKLDPFTAAETFQIKCDVHPWMNAVVRVFDHPYFATTGEDGKFSIDAKGLKDGTYSLQAWHEVYKDSEPQTVEIKDGKATKELEFIFKTGAKAQGEPLQAIHLASFGGTPVRREAKSIAVSN